MVELGFKSKLLELFSELDAKKARGTWQEWVFALQRCIRFHCNGCEK